jgi:CelD/BcsL family acetyltransferase involved in cellulose biosynthesis
MIRIEVQEGSGSDAIGQIRDDWHRLFQGVNCSPFLSWEWMSTWFEHFGEGRTAFLIKAYRNDKVIGLLPMIWSNDAFLGITKKKLSLMGDSAGGADHLELICDPADYDEAFTAILRFLHERGDCDLIRFDSLSSESRSIDLLRKMGSSSGNGLSRFSMAMDGVCPQIDLSSGWETVLKNGKRAANFKRRLKKLEKRADFEFRTVIAESEAGTAFERFLKLHQKRWEQSGGSELTGHPRLVEFQRDLVVRMAKAGLARFDELWLDGECRSSVYGLDDGRTFYYYNSGYDLDYADLSVGLVLIGLSIKSAVERGNKLYDFLRGDETYKFDWANQSVEIVNVTFGRNSVSSAAADKLARALARVKKIGKAVLPEGLTASIANRRRAWKRSYQLSER